MKLIMEKWQNYIKDNSIPIERKQRLAEGILGQHVWPSADKHASPLARQEKDTEIERELYIQLHKHFGTSSYFLKGGEPPLGAKAIEAIESILSSNEYPNVFKKCPSGMMLRGMQVPIEWIRKHAPNALVPSQEESSSKYPNWAPERSSWKDDWADPVEISFEYESKGKYGGVSSWTPKWRVARMFSITQNRGGMVACIVYASCDSGLFLNTAPFAKYEGGAYADGDKKIKKLNPASHESEYLLFGNCRVHAIQVPRQIVADEPQKTEKEIMENWHSYIKADQTKKPVSYGILPYRLFNNRIEFLLGMPPQGNYWTVFKGAKEGRETAHETAAREFQEETGFVFPREAHFSDDKILTGIVGKGKKQKELKIWLVEMPDLQIVDFDVEKVVPIDTGHYAGQPEIVKIEWITAETAVERMPPSQKTMIAQAEGYLDLDPGPASYRE